MVTGAAPPLIQCRFAERDRVGIEGHPAPDDLDPERRVPGGGDLDGQAEAVEQLGTQLALLGIHRPDQHEARCVRDRHPVALDRRAAHRRGVEQQVDEVVVQQVDLVDVQDPAVRLGEQPGLVVRLAGGQGALEVQRAEHPVLGGTDRQLDEPHRTLLDLGARDLARVAVERVVGGDLDRRQDSGEGAHDRRLGGALLAAHQHTADRGRDRRQHQGQRHVPGLDDRRERQGGAGKSGRVVR